MKPRTTVTHAEYLSLMQIVRNYLRTHDFITNRSLRHCAGINYDQAINFFRRMVDDGKLIREGKSSSTKYYLAKK